MTTFIAVEAKIIAENMAAQQRVKNLGKMADAMKVPVVLRPPIRVVMNENLYRGFTVEILGASSMVYRPSPNSKGFPGLNPPRVWVQTEAEVLLDGKRLSDLQPVPLSAGVHTGTCCADTEK